MTHWKKITPPKTYSWDVKNTHNLIYSWYFQIYLNTFDYYITRVASTRVCKIIDEFWNFHDKNKIFLNISKD